ncbi:TIM barrel protein [Micromonospora globbae]|uniref:TIM barrel protein n=1 Tax=Micromonospora globbae TaxID=1894969 RepID=UPI00343EC58F
MTASTPAAVGLYSIGIGGIDLEDLLALAVAHQVPFLHLRGGRRGFDLARRDTATLDRWARCCRVSVPITVVAADLDLVDFARPDTQAYQQASTELDRLGHAAAALGAYAIRLLARRVVDQRQWADLAVPNLVARYGLTTLVELHDPAWFTAQTLAALAAHLDRAPWLALLIDTAQVHRAWLRSDNPDRPSVDVSVLVPHTRAVHISDNGEGLTGTGHRIVARTFGRMGDDSPVEVAFEWTGADRSPQGCLARYRRAAAWWRASLEGNA